MYLKQIIATGFKSFADKTVIDFKEGLTGIVGPNGSGKSNVVDAVRWVLGEQSVKSLRGDGSMTDVIFSGSKSRNPASYASVELVFNNTDHYFHVEYSEVSIKRTVYRTGENEYFINDEKCRLKDIVNLVIDNGIGRDAFNIISQGNVQEILSSKSEDRRIIFDEAAGVSKYKKRKLEALKKLEKTNSNITRVNDIILELEQQLSPLYEQSMKATKYIDAKKELQQIEIALIKTDINTINKEYQESKIKIDTLNNEISSFLSQNSTILSQIEKEKLEHSKLNEQIYTLQKELLEVTANVERLSGEKKMANEREKYNSEDMKVHANIVHLKESILRLSHDINVLELEIKKENHQKQQVQLEFDQVRLKMKDEKNTETTFEREFHSLKQLEMNLSHQIRSLEISIEENSAMPSAVKMVLSNPKLNVKHVLGKLIESKDEYVRAIDIALGYNANFMVVNHENEAKGAIEYLKNNRLGRATFLPLNVIKPKTLDQELLNNIKHHPSYIDVASNLVTYDKKYENVVLNNLGQTIIVKDMDGANEIAKLIRYRAKIVSLDGELIHVGGSVTGGIGKNASSIVGEKNRLDGLQKEIEQTKHKILVLEEKRMKIQESIKQMELKEKEYLFELLKIDEVIANKINRMSQKKLEQEDLEKELNALETNDSSVLDSILETYYKELEHKNELEHNIQLHISKNDQMNKQIEDLEKSVKYNNSDLYQKQNMLKDLEIKQGRMDVKLDTLLSTLNEEYMMTFEKANSEYELMYEVEEARTKVYNLKSILRDLGNVNIDSIEDYKRVKMRYEFLNDQRNDLFKALNTLQEVIKEMDMIMTESFEKTFQLIQVEFSQVFKHLFGGGEASLKLTSPENILETGVDIMALPPGKKLQHISLLSGGEKALTAIALLFAILKVRPVPFCILDEVEAALDENNVLGFSKYVTKLKELTQFIVITHKKKTMEYMDTLYGITMQESGISKLVSVRLEDVRNYVK